MLAFPHFPCLRFCSAATWFGGRINDITDARSARAIRPSSLGPQVSSMRRSATRYPSGDCRSQGERSPSRLPGRHGTRASRAVMKSICPSRWNRSECPFRVPGRTGRPNRSNTAGDSCSHFGDLHRRRIPFAFHRPLKCTYGQPVESAGQLDKNGFVVAEAQKTMPSRFAPLFHSRVGGGANPCGATFRFAGPGVNGEPKDLASISTRAAMQSWQRTRYAIKVGNEETLDHPELALMPDAVTGRLLGGSEYSPSSL